MAMIVIMTEQNIAQIVFFSVVMDEILKGLKVSLPAITAFQ